METSEIINLMVQKLLELNTKESNKSIKISAAKDLFFDFLILKNTNTNTIKYYKNIFYKLDYYFNSLKIDNTNQINDSFLESVIADSLNSNLSNNYINKLIGGTKYFIHTLADKGVISDYQFKTSKLQVQEKRLDVISDSTLHMILNYVNSQSLKTNLIVNLLNDTGVRREELVNIKLSNLSLDKNSILLDKTKCNRIRLCFFRDPTKEILIKYLESYKPKNYLFEKDNSNTPITATSVSKILEKIKVHLNLAKLSAHQFRHTFGTRIYSNSQDIELTRELLGHTDYTMTKRYVHHSEDRLRKKYDMFNSNHIINVNEKKHPNGN